MKGREKLELVVCTILARDRAPQDTMRMLPPYTRLKIERLIAVGNDCINRIDAMLEIECVIDIVPVIKLFLLRVPEMHRVVTVFQIREILVTAFEPSCLAIRVNIVQIAPYRPTMFIFPGTMSLFTLVILIKKVTLEILHRITSVFQIETARQLMPLIVKFMIETDCSLKISFMQVVIVTTIIITFTESNPLRQALLLIIQVTVTRTPTITTFKVGIQGGMG